VLTARLSSGASYVLFHERQEYPGKFFNYFRKSPKLFDELESVVKDSFYEKDTNMQTCIPTKERLAVTLQYVPPINLFSFHLFLLQPSPSCVCQIH
jgi:hypothetical protein